MKRQTRYAFGILILVTLLSACRSHTYTFAQFPGIAYDRDGPVTVETILKEVASLTEAVKTSNPGSKVLVWLYKGAKGDFSPSLNNAIDEYLASQKAGYFLVLYPIPDQEYDYSSLLEQYMQQNGVCDIFNVGSIADFVTDKPSRNFRYYIDHGIYLPITDYVRGPGGKKLVETLGEEYWKALEVDGEIYGVSSSLTFFNSGAPHFLIHEDAWELLDHDKINADALEALFWNEEQLLLLKEKLGQRIPLSIGPGSGQDLVDILFYQDRYVRIGTLPLFWDTLADQPTVVPLWDMERFRNYQPHMESLQSKELITTIGDSSVAWIHLLSGNTSKLSEVTMEGERFIVAPIKSYGWIVSGSSFFGISSASQYPEEAFDLICRVMTDPVLNNLFCYGVPEQDYSLANGKVVMGPNQVRRFRSFANALLINIPVNLVSIDSNEFFRDLKDKTYCLPYTNTVVDLTVFEEEVSALLAWQNSCVDYLCRQTTQKLFDAWISRAPSLSPEFTAFLVSSIQQKVK